MLRPVRALLLVLTCSLLVLAGCGGDDSGAGGDARAEALSHLPKDSPGVFLITTDPESSQVKDLLAIVRQFPGGDGILKSIGTSLAQDGLNYDSDVKPLLGNPLALALTDASGDDLVGALQTGDAEALQRTVEAGESRRTGEYEGATLYSDDDGDVTAVNEGLVVFGESAADVRAAIDRAANDDGVTEEDLDALRGDLPEEALVSGFGNLEAVLSGSDAAQARRVPWVRALKGYAFAVVTDGDGVGLELRADTTGQELQPAQLPLATGPAAPRVAETQEVAVGLRDPSQLYTFAIGAARAVDPEGTTEFEANLSRIRGVTDVDLVQDVIERLDSDSSVIVDLANLRVAMRATAKEPDALRTALGKLRPVVPSALSGAGIEGATVRQVRPGLWAVEQSGSVVGAFGVVGDQFVAGNARPEELEALARRPASPLDGARGAMSLRVPATAIGELAEQQGGFPPAIAAFIASKLGDLEGWLRAEPGELRGSFRLPVR